MSFTIYKGIIYSILLTFFLSCNSTPNNPMEKNLPKLVENPEQINPDFYFRVVLMEETDSSYFCTLKSMDGKDTVGMKMEVMKGIKPGLYEDDSADIVNGFSENKIKFIRIKGLSENLVQAMEKQFNYPISYSELKEVISPLVFSSNKVPIEFTNDVYYSLKMFLKNNLGAEAEVFAVIDCHRRLFEFKAKDPSFFQPLIDAFILEKESK